MHRGGTILAVLGLLACIPGTGRAAPPMPVDVNGEPPRRYLDVASLRTAYFGRLMLPSRSGGDSVTLAARILRAKIQAGHYFKGTGTVLAGSVGYDLLAATADTAAGVAPTRALHHLSVRLALGQRVHRKWMLTAFAKPGVASDFRGFRARDLQLSAGLAARFAYGPDLVFVFGALYNNGVFGHLVLPVLHIRYRWRRLRVHFLFPHRAELWLVPHRMLELGVVGGFTAGVFGIHQPAAQRTLGDRLSSLFVTAGLAVRSFLIRGFYLSAEGGYLVRYLQLFKSGQQTHGRLYFRGWYVSTAMGYLL